MKVGFGEPIFWSCSLLSGHFQPHKQGTLHVSLCDVLRNLGLLTFPQLDVSGFFFNLFVLFCFVFFYEGPTHRK